MNKPLKIIFAGTPIFAAEHLSALLASNYQVLAVFTQPDRSSGRGQKIHYSKVKELTINYNIPCFQPINLNTKKIYNIIKNINADVMLVVAYGLILPASIIRLFPQSCINIHPSLLPRWRGPAPIQWALLEGDKKTGVTVIKMNNNIDTGDILYSNSCYIEKHDTYDSLQKKLIVLSIEAMLTTLCNLVNNTYHSSIQDNRYATYAKKINKIDAKLNWHINAITLERCVRAFNPSPVTFFLLNKVLIKVWQATTYLSPYENKKIGEIIIADKTGIHINTIDGIFNIVKLQISGKKIMTTEEFLNSKKSWFQSGNILK